MRLWHDDVRPAPAGWVWARTNAQAKEHLLTGQVREISMDHDLGYHDVVMPDDPKDPDALMEILVLRGVSEDTGLHLAHWMVENHRVPSRIRIHSWNPDGAKNMAAVFNRHGHNCEVRPFNPSELAV